MKIAFTICSNNYWAQAKVLFKSLHETNPDYKLVLGLVDKKHKEVDYTIDGEELVDIVEVSQLNIPDKFNIFQKYNIIELNTAVKPSYIKWIKEKYVEAEVVLYFDPDIKIFSSLFDIESSLRDKSIVLTPHIYNPIPNDNLNPTESVFLNYGVFNLGFIGISFKNRKVFDFLDWWENHLMIQCFINPSYGIFVDQLPINHAPIFFPDITQILFNYGMNAAPWNLHERQITLQDGKYYANKDLLIFFHFSNIHFSKGKHPIYNRYEIYPVLENLYEKYRSELIKNSFLELKSMRCFYKVQPVKMNLFSRIMKNLTPPGIVKIVKKIKK